MTHPAEDQAERKHLTDRSYPDPCGMPDSETSDKPTTPSDEASDADRAGRAFLPIAIGTALEEGEDGWGISLSTFDVEDGCFAPPKPGARYGNSATFLCRHPSLPLVYSVGRSEKFPNGSVAVFKVHHDTMELVAEASSGGSTPCHLAIDETGTVLALANYDDGTTSTLTLDHEGIPSLAFSTRTVGNGPNRERQDGSHPHGVYFHGATLHVPDLGLDKIHRWQLDLTSAKPDYAAPSSWSSTPGAGPRHMAFSHDGHHAYVVHELDSTVSALAHNETGGTLTTIHSVSTLPEGETVSNTAAEIAIHPNDKFVYVSNRGHDSIAVFARDSTSGSLKRILIAPAGGANPRHFALSPDGRWLLCAHQDSGTIAALPLDPKSGMMGEAKVSIHCRKPICILFLV